ncbi:four helix bundle protein [Eubacterium coprostanoligenes]|uniref:Four helix bundle protein n=1 Tax=Eubacterium coprostanoligenes TaxID=290054 RepID=A0A1T4N8M2_9FIRM|nr:four helix bundle protein [Eubacterium coprostanoligenes]SJZ75198.1 four helix bundle protein [Eubacterium coprostanoligenes]
MGREKTVKYKSKKFAVRIVRLYKYLCDEKKEYVLSKQLLRSGTSIGANIAESECAISEKDFLSKIYIALKESAETIYWLDLLFETDYLSEIEYKSMKDDCEELRKMMSSTTKTMNSKLNSAHSKLTKGGTTEGEV